MPSEIPSWKLQPSRRIGASANRLLPLDDEVLRHPSSFPLASPRYNPNRRLEFAMYLVTAHPAIPCLRHLRDIPAMERNTSDTSAPCRSAPRWRVV
jgi:hypothetical protein